jgi:hypothetical protein
MLDDEQLLHAAQRLLVKLAQTSGTFPPSLFIDDIQNPLAISSGAFADIYRAQRPGRIEVALKKLRVFQGYERAKVHNVRCVSFVCRFYRSSVWLDSRCCAMRRYCGSSLGIGISYSSSDLTLECFRGLYAWYHLGWNMGLFYDMLRIQTRQPEIWVAT